MSGGDLFRLVYVSRNTLGVEAMAEAELAHILAASRRNNAASGVTGALLSGPNCFAQVLEGPLPAIEATFERIQRDLRHGQVTVLAATPVPLRDFPDWSMAHVAEEGAAALGGVEPFAPGRCQGCEAGRAAPALVALLRALAARAPDGR